MNKLYWAGHVASALPAIMLLFSGGLKLLNPPELAAGFASLGWDVKLALALGIVEIASTFIYLVPRTAVLGAILLTGYLGGAIATHVRIGEPFIIPAVMGVLVWLGLYLRDERLRQLLPLVADPGSSPAVCQAPTLPESERKQGDSDAIKA